MTKPSKLFLASLLLLLSYSTPVLSQQQNFGAGVGSSCVGAQCINASSAPYSMKADVQKYFDASWISNGTTVTITGNDTPFGAGLNGKLCFGMPGIAPGPGAAGTFTFLTATTGTCTPSGSLVGAPSGNGVFAVGDDDTIALQTATAAAYAICKQGSTLVLPAGSFFLSAGIGGNGGTGCAQQAPPGTISSGFSVAGQGYTATYGIPLPGFNFATTGSSGFGCSSAGCFWNNAGVNTTYENFTIDGFGQNGSGITTGLNALFTLGPNSLAINVDLFNWMTSTNGSTPGASCTGQSAYGLGFSVQNFGVVANTIQSNVFTPNTCILLASASAGTLAIANGSDLHDSEGNYTSISDNGGVFRGHGTITQAQSGTNTALGINNNSIVFLEDAYMARGLNSSTVCGTTVNSGGTLVSTNSSFNGGSSGGGICGVGTWVNFGGGNPLAPAGIPVLFTGTYVDNTGIGSVPLFGKCTGTATSTATLGLRMSGTSTTGTGVASTCTSTTIDAGSFMQKSGTIYELIVTATNGGFNASSGVVTVLKNGSTQTMTCTLGTGTTCQDGATAHQVSFVRGDLISIQFTTQATETLAGVQASLVVN